MEFGIDSYMPQEDLTVSFDATVFPTDPSAPPESTFFDSPPSDSDPSQYHPTSGGMSYPKNSAPLAQVMRFLQSNIHPPRAKPYYPQQGPINQALQPKQQQPQAVVLNNQPVGVAPRFVTNNQPMGVTPGFVMNNQPMGVAPGFVMNNQPMGVTPVVVVGEPPVSMIGAIVLSCFVFWLCGWIFGGIAFILAMIGHSSATAGDSRGAIQMRNISYGLSIAGIVIGIIIIAVVAGVLGSRATYSRSYNYCYDYYYGSYYYCY